MAVLFAVLAWRSVVSPWLLFLPAAVFLWLVRRHDRVLRARDRAARAIRLYEDGLARLDDRWGEIGEPGERFRDDAHVYANDLDLFGRGSLFQLLSQARTWAGEATLASWLIHGADETEIRRRQHAVAELAPELDVREHLALAGSDVRARVQTDRLLEWAETAMAPARGLHTATWLFSAATLTVIMYVGVTWIWPPLAGLLIVQTLVFRRFRDQINAILSTSDAIEPDDLPLDVRDRNWKAAATIPTGMTLEEMERQYIETVLRENEGHRGKTARALGIDPKTLYNKLGPERPRGGGGGGKEK